MTNVWHIVWIFHIQDATCSCMATRGSHCTSIQSRTLVNVCHVVCSQLMRRPTEVEHCNEMIGLRKIIPGLLTVGWPQVSRMTTLLKVQKHNCLKLQIIIVIRNGQTSSSILKHRTSLSGTHFLSIQKHPHATRWMMLNRPMRVLS